MTKKNDVASERLRSFVERIESLEEEKQAIQADIREVKSEAKAVGFDVKTINKILRERRLTTAQIAEEQALLDIYRASLGMLHDTPLGSAARERLEKRPDDKKPGKKPGKKPAATPPPPKLEEPYGSATIEQARDFGRKAAETGQPVTDNPFPANDKRRAAWDEAWCAATGSDGMEIPKAWQRKKPENEKKDPSEKPDKKDDGKKGGKK